MYKIEFKLKQHTPIIHFQHHQDGATLRATEVKPKFDNYLLERVRSEVEPFIQKNNHREFLKYKVKIILLNTTNLFREGIEMYEAGNRDRNTKPLVLTNLGKPEVEKKKFTFVDSENLLKIQISCDNAELCEVLKFYFPEFLFSTNFGNRNSKGFGSFYIDEDDSEYVNPSEFNEKYFFSKSYDSPKNDDFIIEDALNHIHVFHKAIRSGIHDGTFQSDYGFTTRFYLKSLIFKYAVSHKIQWDKKSIKSDILNLDEDDKLSTFSQKYLIKDLLGLSTNESWKTIKNKNEKRIIDENVTITKEHSNPSDSKKTITRMASPLIYKPIYSKDGKQLTLYFLINKPPSKMLGSKFKIKASGYKDESDLDYPSKDINVKDFFKFMFEKNQYGNYDLIINDLVEERFKSTYDRDLRRNIENEKLTIVKNIINNVRSNIIKKL